MPDPRHLTTQYRAWQPPFAWHQRPRGPTQAALGAAICILAISLGACGKQGVSAPALPPATLDNAQRSALRQLNEAGAKVVQNETRSFEFGAPCILRVAERQGDRMVRFDDVPLQAYTVEIIEYASGGTFGVKAYPIKAGGSIDLIDAPSRASAESLLLSVQILRESCATPAPK